jgi:hypothetical protein
MSVLLLLSILLNFWLAAYVIWLTLPFALMAFAGVGLAIYCGWRTGIYIFIGEAERKYSTKSRERHTERESRDRQTETEKRERK